MTETSNQYQAQPQHEILPNAVYRLKQVFTLTRLSPATHYRAMQRGELKTRRIGRSTLVLGRDLLTWITRETS